MANNSNLSKRAALRKQQELEARRKRNARMLGVGMGVLALVVVILIAVVIMNAVGSKAPAAEQLTPPNATEGHGIAIKSKNTQPAGDAPNVVVYEDYQCPACKAYEARYGNAFLQLVDEGKITFEVRTAYFLNDVNKATNKKSSERAALAAAAADAVGKYREYHQVVYEKPAQPRGRRLHRPAAPGRLRGQGGNRGRRSGNLPEALRHQGLRRFREEILRVHERGRDHRHPRVRRQRQEGQSRQPDLE